MLSRGWVPLVAPVTRMLAARSAIETVRLVHALAAGAAMQQRLRGMSESLTVCRSACVPWPTTSTGVGGLPAITGEPTNLSNVLALVDVP